MFSVANSALQLSFRNTISLSSRTNLDGDIDEAFDLRAEQLLSYLCFRERLTDQRWKSIILSMGKEIAQTIKVDVAKRHDHMNIRAYVHVKKLFVFQDQPDAELIWGVVCNKSVIHNSMADPLKDASVMIVAGSIEYERVPGRLSTLEPILNQEGEFLAKQVERILSRRPSVLLVEGNVSRLALELLCHAGVRVVVNVSMRVLHRVARSTGADILPSSDAQLVQQNIGFCPHFSQRTVEFKDGRQKLLLSITMLYCINEILKVFNECHPDRGCSVLLKGSDARELKVVKRILLFLITVQYSSLLEKAFLNLFNVRMSHQISNCEVCEARREAVNQNNEKSDFVKCLNSSILTASPFICYEPPYLESAKGKNCSLIPYFNLPVYHFYTNDDFDARQIEEKSEVQWSLDRQRSISVPAIPRHNYAINGARDARKMDDLNSFRALGGAIFKKRLRCRRVERCAQTDSKVRLLLMTLFVVSKSLYQDRQRLKRHDMLDPYVHQRLAVLFGSFSGKSPNAPYFCVRPWVVSMEFYGLHDMTLGEFLTKFCFSKSYECPSSNCEVPMLDHARKLVSCNVTGLQILFLDENVAHTRLSKLFTLSRFMVITTQIVISNTEESSVNSPSHGQVFAWNYCDSCKISSPVTAMNSAVWHLSFGKYLDYLAYSTFSKVWYLQAGAASLGLQECSHCFFHELTHFYSQGNYIANFKVTPIRPYNVQFSPVQCQIVPNQYSKQTLLDGVTRIASLADDIIRTAEGRLSLVEQNEHYNQYAGTSYNALRRMVDRTTVLLEEKRKLAEELRAVDKTTILSNDIYAIKANEALMYIREAIYQLITVWNERSAALAATLRVSKRTAEDGGVIPEVLFPYFPAPHFGLEKIDDPFPPYLHLGLELKPRVGVIVRDIVDSKGNYRPDIGSIIAYALSTVNYEKYQQKEGNCAKGFHATLNPGATNVALEEEPLGAEHVEFEFQDNQASYYVKSFVQFASHYFEYIKTAVAENKLTSLCKVYGVFRVGYKSKTAQMKADILVMEYLFYKCNVDQVWDLKGSLRNRMAATGKSTSDLVLLDENLMKDLWNKQLYIYPHAKAALNQAISNDSHFLSSQHVMDYSLLVGVDETNGELILGIVDYMRTYTLDKKLESWVKIVAIPGAHLPTILSPEMYCTRFSDAIDTYFPVIPDQWTGLGSAVSY
uniref:1-phosphatidylinositol-3-phosphate 5-kinase n=1 Tax=Angiostrongylus cantonensis TaxID=6313 RepID=A0A158P7A5_ANGCA